ncbi:MAG: PKD domain-containing protein [Candidatus Omnitrophota bacterium]
MRKTTVLILSALLLSGCATYKFQKGQSPHDKGYVASREGYTILEYTIGTDNTVPLTVGLAKERFKRRRRVVEHYYKKMGNIENRFKEAVVDYPVMFFKLALGAFKMPGIAVKDFRYERNPKYRERIDKLEEEKEAQEQARIKKLKDALDNYIQKDVEKEKPKVELKQEVPEQGMVEKTPAPETKAAVLEKVELKEERQSEKSIKKVSQAAKEPDKNLQIKAVITARPEKGFSPLRVHFSGNKSHSKSGKIIFYSWNFGDGDTSTKENPVNTYYSGSFEPREFTVALTVQDSTGNTASTTTTIEALNK